MGYDIVRYDASRTSAGRRVRLLAERRIDVVLDVGANDGPFARGLRQAGYRGRIVSFEPQHAAFERLGVACQSDPAWDCRQVALGSADSELELHVAGNSSSSSLLEMTPQHTASAPSSRYIASELVAVRRLDAIRGEVVRPADAVYLKLDVQGFELEVMRGADETLSQILVVESELSLTRLYENGATLVDVVGHLDEHGFELVSLEPAFVDERDGRLLQVDGIFTRSAS
jgi:FkbM family methyltransferase